MPRNRRVAHNGCSFFEVKEQVKGKEITGKLMLREITIDDSFVFAVMQLTFIRIHKSFLTHSVFSSHSLTFF